jgi:hypothetical protein
MQGCGKKTASEILEELEEESSYSLSSLRTKFSTLEREENLALKSIISEQEKQISILKKYLNIESILSDVETPKPIRVRHPKSKRPKAFQLHLSDTHSREIVTLTQTDGRNEHNAEIGRERLRTIILKAISEIKKECSDSYPCHLTIWGGGDYMVNADLHYKMERCVDEEPLIEMEHVYEMLNEELGLLLSKSPADSHSFVGSFSNHGRDSERMVLGFESARSYDTAIYKRLAKDFEEVDFVIANTTWTVEDVNGFKTLYTHGHAKKSSVKRSPSGVMIPKWNFMNEMRVNYDFDAWAQGHFHTHSVLWSNGICHIQNGCLVVENSFSAASGFPWEPPSQNLVVVDLENNRIEKVIALYA